jgi:HPt (histidine-containing phosphotransfer) domain-containing protein
MQRDVDQEPVLDLDHLLTFTDGDMELEGELSVLFLSSAEGYFDTMRRALREGRCWTSSVHALKGASANLGALRVAALARAAEHQPPDAATLQEIRHAMDEVGAFFGERQRIGSKAH